MAKNTLLQVQKELNDINFPLSIQTFSALKKTGIDELHQALDDLFNQEELLELYLRKVVKQLEEGGLPKQTTKEVLKALDELKHDVTNPLKVLATLQMRIPGRLLEGHFIEYSPVVFGKREVILSLYFSGKMHETC